MILFFNLNEKENYSEFIKGSTFIKIKNPETSGFWSSAGNLFSVVILKTTIENLS